MPSSSLDKAEHNLRGILERAIEHTSECAAVVVWDGESRLSTTLSDAYRRCLPEARFIAFEEVEREAILAAFDELAPGDLVVLVQSTRFRLNAYRFRMELFKRSLKVIEHPHLARMTEAEGELYIDALAYDEDYFRGVGNALKVRIDRASAGSVTSEGAELVFSEGFEEAKLNVGDYRAMANIGGQFPIGEVITESKSLQALDGTVRIHAFGDTSFAVNQPDVPFTLVIEKGRVTDVLNSTPEFDSILDNIRADEGEVWVREFGLGLNRAFSQERIITDIGTYERMCGVHLSLGKKHHIFNKPEIKKKRARHHVDVFVISDAVLLDGDVVYQEGAWVLSGDGQGAPQT